MIIVALRAISYVVVVEYSRQRDVADLNILVGPFVEEFDASDLFGDILGQHHIPTWAVNFDLLGVRHAGRLVAMLLMDKVPPN